MVPETGKVQKGAQRKERQHRRDIKSLHLINQPTLSVPYVHHHKGPVSKSTSKNVYTFESHAPPVAEVRKGSLQRLITGSFIIECAEPDSKPRRHEATATPLVADPGPSLAFKKASSIRLGPEIVVACPGSSSRTRHFLQNLSVRN